MNIEYAQTIPLRDILGKLGLQPAQQNDDILFYPSPFCDLDSALSFLINSSANTWLDKRLGASGGPVEFIRNYLVHCGKPCALSDVLHWLRFNIGYPPLSSLVTFPVDTAQGIRLKLRTKTILSEAGLIRYAQSRGVPVAIARQHFKQLYILNEESGKEFLALGFKNEEGGYTIFSPFVEALVGPAAIAFLHGEVAKPGSIQLFKDIFDYLHALGSRDYVPFDEDTIILNSYSLLDNAAAYIRGYGYRKLYSWFNDCGSGQQARDACSFLARTEDELSHIPMRLSQYQGV